MPIKRLFLRDDIAAAVGETDPFACFANLEGEEYRALESRRTYAVKLAGKPFFVKYHRGTGIREILKNILQLRLPVTSARNEWQAINALKQRGIAVPEIAGYGKRGLLPWQTESFIVTEDVGTQLNLEDLTREWPTRPPSFRDKQALIHKVATISRVMHSHGICHRDFYLCHFLVKGGEQHQLVLIDLHRALVKKNLGMRWIVKDVGSLYFSAMAIGLTQRDLLRFVRGYSGTSLRNALAGSDFWLLVVNRARKLYRRHNQGASR